MSRLIVKNLPSYVTPARLQQYFEQKGAPKGTLTDVKVALKPDGTSRRFGFVGYKSEKEALAAKEWFDKTFVDSTRISVNVIEVSSLFYFLELDPVVLTEAGAYRALKMHQHLDRINVLDPNQMMNPHRERKSKLKKTSLPKK